MEIAVRARDIELNESLVQQVERSIEFALDRHKSRIIRISAYLADLNGPRGGVDKLCQMTAEVRGARPVLIRETGEDLLAVINRAAHRLGYRVARKIQRQRTPPAREYRATTGAA